MEVNDRGNAFAIVLIRRHGRHLAEELDVDARFWGHVDNDSQLYETAIFFFTSEAENFPIVLLEAMIAGATVITSSGTGCAEVVADSGLLVPVRDPQAIRQALMHAIEVAWLYIRLAATGRGSIRGTNRRNCARRPRWESSAGIRYLPAIRGRRRTYPRRLPAASAT